MRLRPVATRSRVVAAAAVVATLGTSLAFMQHLESRGDLFDPPAMLSPTWWGDVSTWLPGGVHPMRGWENESAVEGERYRHALYTHCGARTTLFARRRWLATPLLERDNSARPAWGFNFTHGTMVLERADRARFVADNGLTAVFAPAPRPLPPSLMCA